MESIYIVNKNTDERKIRLSVRKEMEERCFSAAFADKALTLYDIARDIAMIPRGKVIMEADFGYILDNIPEVPDRFKFGNKGYKKAIFALLNQMAFHSKFLDEYTFCDEVSELGLTPQICKIIYWTVLKKGFYFRADVYRMALRNLRQGQRTGKMYKLIPGQYYTKLEQEMMRLLQADMSSELQPGEDDPLGIKGAGITAGKVGFLKAEKSFAQYTEIRAHIMELISKHGYEFSDFAVVFSSKESHRNGTACFVNFGFPVVSSVSVNQPDSTLEILTLIRNVLDLNIRNLVDYYNRIHNNDAERFFYEPDFDFPKDIGSFITLLEKTDEELRERGRYIPKAFISFLTVLKDVTDRKTTPAGLMKTVSDISDRLGIKGEKRVFEYRESVEKVFGESLKLKDGIDYLSEILLPRKKAAFTNDNCGVTLAMMEEYIPKCRIIYFVDMEEGFFLKDNAPNPLLSDQSHEEFNRLVYGCTKEEHLRSIFASYIRKASDRLFFVIPCYSEATIPTHYLEYIYALFPGKEYDIKVLGSSVPDFRAELPFNVDDITYENFPAADCYTPGEDVKNDNFAPVYKGDVRKRVGSATSIEKFISCPARAAYESHQPKPHVQNREHFDRGNAFHYFMEKVLVQKKLFKPEYKNLDLLRRNICSYIKGTCSPDEPDSGEFMLFSAFDELGVKKIFEEICRKYPDLELTDKDFSRYLYFLCRFMEELAGMDADPESFMPELEIEGIDLPLVPGVRIKNTRADFVCRSSAGDILIFDFKSGSISDYKEDILNYGLVQLPVYGAVLREKFGKHPVTAAYVSYVGDYKKVDGCGEKAWEDYYGCMAEELNKLLDEADRGIFRTKINHNCEYCPLAKGCPELKTIRKQKDICLCPGDKIYTGYPLIDTETKGEKRGIPEKKLIMFTGEKGIAVSDLKRDIAVVAGAGAGKTELLSSRYVNLIVNGGCTLEEILCITFTEKATGEMQNRIFRKICDTIELNAFYSVESGSYTLTQEQRERLLEAKRSFFSKNRISTNHSFCRNMLLRFEKVRKDSDRDIEAKVADDYIINEKKEEILKRLIDSYREKSENFMLWSRYISRKTLTEEFLNLMNRIKLSGTALSESSRVLFDRLFDEHKKILLTVLENMNERLGEISDNLIQVFREYIEEETNKNSVNAVLKKIERLEKRDFSAVGNDTCTAKVYKSSQRASSLLAEFKKIYRMLKPEPDISALPENFEKNIRLDIFDLMTEAEKEIEAYKTEKSVIELSDFPIYMTELLENEEIRKQISGEIRHIMVDEFQDSNWLQKKILDGIHTPENTLFIVGDEKQAIYRFQQCDNQIFEYFKKKEGTLVVSLNENYRSKEKIVNFSNSFFSSCNKYSSYRIINESMIPVRKEKNPGKRVFFTNIYFSKDDKTEDAPRKDLIRRLKIKEGDYIANLIRKNGKEKYGSWGILIRSYTDVSYILEALRTAGIPYSFIMKRDFFNLPEIYELILLLKVIYGILPESVLASFPVLAELYRRERDPGKGVLFTLQEIIASREYSLHMGRTQGAASYISVFTEYLGEVAEKFDNCPESIFNHLDSMTEENTKECVIAVAESVKIMTVHSSKGLEFDNLILAKVTSRDYMESEELSFINLSQGDGLVTDFGVRRVRELNDGDSEFPFSVCMKYENTEFDEREYANLLYVALTRARDNLFVTLRTENYDADKPAVPDANWYKNILSNLDSVPAAAEIENIHFECIATPEAEKGASRSESMPFIREEGFSDLLEYGSVSRYLNGETDEEEAKAEYTGGENRDNRSNDIGTAVHSWFEKKLLEIKYDAVDPENIDSKMLELPADIKKKAENFIRKGLMNKEYRELVRNAAGMRAEAGILFRHEDRMLYGIMDLVVGDGREFVILDYKTHTGGRLDRETLDRYSRQVSLYAQGLAALYPGMPIRKMLLVMPTEGDAVMVEVK